jgi:hypothetical protein
MCSLSSSQRDIAHSQMQQLLMLMVRLFQAPSHAPYQFLGFESLVQLGPVVPLIWPMERP